MNARWITFEEAARVLGVSRPTARTLLASGEVPGLADHFGTARIDRVKFLDWLKKNTEEQK